jgi:outer membrane lipoprotein SlyB
LSRSGRIFIPPGAIYFRKQIRAVRLEYSDTHNELVGFAIGGAIGGALGASGSGDPRGRFAAGLIIGIGGGALGALLGRDFPIFHRKTIYHQ